MKTPWCLRGTKSFARRASILFFLAFQFYFLFFFFHLLLYVRSVSRFSLPRKEKRDHVHWDSQLFMKILAKKCHFFSLVSFSFFESLHVFLSITKQQKPCCCILFFRYGITDIHESLWVSISVLSVLQSYFFKPTIPFFYIFRTSIPHSDDYFFFFFLLSFSVSSLDEGAVALESYTR
jgi:hypothetical protein